MKYLLLFGFGMSVLLSSNSVFGESMPGNPDNPQSAVHAKTINILTTPDLSNLTADWIRAYSALNPGVRFSVGNTDGSAINTTGTIYILSSDSMASSSGWKISIGYNVIVPVFNAKNPMLREIVEQGISVGEFASVFSGSGKINWSDLISGGQNKPVVPYIIENAEIKAGVSDFIQADPAALHAHLMTGTAEFNAAIQKDLYAIGFCRLSDVRRAGQNAFVENIRLLPIDKNGNDRLDLFERIYNSPDDLSRGAWVGKYPHALSGSIYAISQSKPTDKDEIAFMEWIMSDEGGKFLVSNGYCDLISLEKRANLATLYDNPGNEAKVNPPLALPWLIILVLLVFTGLIVLVYTLVFTRSGHEAAEEALNANPALNENTVISPKGLYYDKTHTWAFMEHDGMVRVGVDDFLLHVTGTITRIKMKEAGEFVRRGEKIVTLIKFGKQLSLYSPVSGTIKARNAKLLENSSLMNNSPYAEGWVYLVEPKNWLRELQLMWMGEKHLDWLKEEFMRLRNFFEGTLKAHHAKLEFAILQDGGELRANLLADLEPEVWEEFQRLFIDPSR
jgi:glycine cleavage system H lipoate-binding protein/ABC-type phosphate transport system substrate-binding protein